MADAPISTRLNILTSIGIVVTLLLTMGMHFQQPHELEEERTPLLSSTQESLLWSQTAQGSSSTDVVYGMDFDAAGNLYVCGEFYGTTQFGTITLSSSGSQDAFVGKLSSAGNWLWVVKGGGGNSDNCQDLDVDDGGNVSVTGRFYSYASFGTYSISSRGSYDMWVAKLDTNGTWLWVQKGGSSSDDYGYGVAIGDDGRVYVTGSYYSTAYFDSHTLSHYQYHDGFVVALETTGQFLWAQRMYGQYYDYGYGIDVNDNNELSVTGRFSYWINIGGNQLSPSYQSSSYYRVFIAKYTTAGNHVWSKYAGYGSSSYSAYGEDVSIDDNGEVYFTGWFQYRMQFDNTWIYAYQQSNNWDCFVAKYNAQGNYVWAQNAGSSSSDYCYAIDINDATGESVVAGHFHSTIWFGNSYVTNRGSSDAFIAKIPASGGWGDVHTFGGSSSEYGYAVAMANGTTAYGGYFHGTAYDEDNQISLTAMSSADGFIIVYGIDSDGDGVGDGTDVFPNESSQWSDYDGDGFGDNASGYNGDNCMYVFGNSTYNMRGCVDSDGDTVADMEDDMPEDPTQWEDTDGDGFGNNPNGTNPDGCPMLWGNSWRDQHGCLDLDGDGQSILNDRFPSQPTQWNDSDGDGRGDNWGLPSMNDTRKSHWPGEWIEGAATPDMSPLDWDDDGFEDGGLDGLTPWDDCEYEAGDSWKNLVGCPDSDGDGWADIEDEVPDNPEQHEDADGDGFGDDPEGAETDECPNRHGNSTIDRFGCTDNDGDGVSNDNDDCPIIAGLPSNGCPDRDGDGYVDEAEQADVEVDDCPDVYGTSSIGLFGCLDNDGDGVADSEDAFDEDPTQYDDQDGDGYGDNPDGNNADDCPARPGNSSLGSLLGCEDWDGDGYSDTVDPFPQNSLLWSDLDGDGFADQLGSTNLTDDCPSEAGNSSLFRKGCPDMDGDRIPDFLDWDIDGDGYSNSDEVRSDPQSNPYDPLDTPQDTDQDGRADDVAENELANSAVLSDTFGQVITGAVLILVLFSVGASAMLLSSTSRSRKNFERMERELQSAEGFQGLAELEEELDEALRDGVIQGSQGMLLKNKIDERRLALEEEMRISQQAEWWAQMGQQQQQQQAWAGWQPTEDQAQWYQQWGQGQDQGQQGNQ